MSDIVDGFNAYHSKMNVKILGEHSKLIKRIFNHDPDVYQAGALAQKTKELLGLVASTVLRCDDCIQYHLEECHKENIPKAAVIESLEIATLVGGIIVIPHLRRAFEYWEAMDQKK